MITHKTTVNGIRCMLSIEHGENGFGLRYIDIEGLPRIKDHHSRHATLEEAIAEGLDTCRKYT
ncbi:MAG TPA: hypothetical protein P5307_05255 [Pirellulaceae bacterium]|nr:hypothetical protein [Pirellulaceae bacterium]